MPQKSQALPKLEFQSRRFRMRPLRRSDYLRWRSAYESMFEKQNEFDLEPKTSRELSRREFTRFLQQNEKYSRQGLIFHFGIFEKKTERLMGFVLVALALRFNVQSARLSYVIFNNYWKHGYGKETTRAAIDFAFRKLKLHRLEAEVMPHNHASVGLLRGLGFQFEGVRRGAMYLDRRWHDHAVYALLAEDHGVRDTRPRIFT